MRRLLLVVQMALMIANCSGSPNDPGLGGVTKAEAEALNQAAEQLDQPTPAPSVIGSNPGAKTN